MLGRDAGAVVLDRQRDAVAALLDPEQDGRSRRACGRARCPSAPARSAGCAPRRRAPRRRRRRRGAGCGPTRRRGRRSPPPPAARPRPARPPRARSGSGRRPSARGRAGRWRGSSGGRPGCASSRGTPSACVSSRSSSSSSSRKPGDREQRRPQLVRGVRDELLPGAVELGELDPHPVERRGQLADLVGVVVDDRLVERALGDQVGRALQTAEPAGMERRDREAEDERDQQRGDAWRTRRRRLTSATVASWSESELDSNITSPPGEQRHGDLRVLAPVVPHPGAHRAATSSPPRARSGRSPSRSRRPRRSRRARAASGLGRPADAEDDHPRVRDEVGAVDEIAQRQRVLRRLASRS